MCQWYQINLPVTGGVNQMQFINANTGWATVEQSTYLYSLIRTTNQGTNWQLIYSDGAKVQNIQFINDSLGYALGYLSGNGLLLKTTNKGYNWTIMQNSGSILFGGFYMINADTGWISAWLFPSGLILRTTNGFQTIENICSGTGDAPATLYFFKEKYNEEYCGYILWAGILSKTTNSGYNWQQLDMGSSGNVNSFSFINKDTGWTVIAPFSNNNRILRTLNGGFNWTSQYLDPLPSGRATNISALNSNKIWCGRSQNYIMASDNSGLIWGNQVSQINDNSGLYMYDIMLGFSWNSSQIARTINGGGPITSINNETVNVLSDFYLMQNYPNPFNNKSNIKYQISKTSYIEIKIFDIEGKEINKLGNNRQNAGYYEVKFDGSNLSSGIYFYSLYVNGVRFDTKKLMLIK